MILLKQVFPGKPMTEWLQYRIDKAEVASRDELIDDLKRGGALPPQLADKGTEECIDFLNSCTDSKVSTIIVQTYSK